HRVPVEGRLKGQPQDEAPIGNETVAGSPAGPKLARRGTKHFQADAVELPHAAEPRCERYLRDREVRVVEQPACEVCPAGPSKLARRHPQLVAEQPAKVPGRDAQAGAKIALRFAVEGTVEDELYRPAHQLGTRPTD